MQALNRFVLMLGGGYAGTALYNNKDNLPVFLGSSISDFARNLKVSGGNANSSVEKQLESLTQDMRALMLSRNGTIVLSSSQGSGLSKVILIMIPGAGVYLWYKGVRLADIKWVSRKSFDQAVAALSTAQDALSKTVTDFRQSVQRKIADFQAQVENRFRAVQDQIDTQVGEVRDGVRSMQNTLDGVDNRFFQTRHPDAYMIYNLCPLADHIISQEKAIQRFDFSNMSRVQRLESGMEDTHNQLEYTNRGIHLLCSVVAESIGTNSRNHRALQNFAQSNPCMAQIADSSSAFPMLDNEPPVLVEYVQQQQQPSYSAPPGVGNTVGLLLGSFPRTAVGAAFNMPVKTPAATETDRDTSNPPCPEGK